MYPDPKALATLELSFTVYAISFPLLWTFSISRKLPKKYNNLADGINLISQSRLLDDDTFADLGSRDDLITDSNWIEACIIMELPLGTMESSILLSIGWWKSSRE